MALELWLFSVVSTVTTIVIFTFILLIFIYLSTDPYPNMQREPTEKCFLDPDTSEYINFSTSLTDRSQLELSVIVPAYNEMDRLPTMLNEALSYLDKRKEHDSKFSFEIIIVDDGSTDHTTEVALKYSKTHGSDKIRLLKLLRNRGKGAAVRFNGAMSVICGSRAHLEAEAIVKRHYLRNLLMYGFKFCVWLLCVRGVRDTQCGFKLFSRTAARVLFHNLHVERWAFDVDLLYLARHFDMEVVEVPVHWHEVGGSKLVPILSWLQMAKDLLLIRLRYSLGAWKIERVHI
ncbi:hypothetical protein AHF37_08023 [Paragonimus kellicotti]|nr:hypothetical protein AHF37_08023 [Paragonimus kellicotti]